MTFDECCIKPLDQDTISKIAAGEIIQRPHNALKELIENSIDAKATDIEINIKNGGLNLIQIIDNGFGIDHSDLAILCKRFTTSKIKNIQDLNSVQSFGFRGEALASISHVSKLCIITKKKTSPTAYKAFYLNGELAIPSGETSSEPLPCAGHDGTNIFIENLFYNNPSRALALKSRASDEFNRITELIQKYSVHYPTISFSCRKHGDARSSFATRGKGDRTNIIRIMYGNSIASNLMDFSVSSDTLETRVNGLITTSDYQAKKLSFLLFVNNRPVESIALKKAIVSVYQPFLNRESHPFVYLSLHIHPERLDVNIHPTKQTIYILHETEICELIVEKIQLLLSQKESERNMKLLQSSISEYQAVCPNQYIKTTPTRPCERHLVRSDNKSKTIFSMMPSKSNESAKESFPDNRERKSIYLISIKSLRSRILDAAVLEWTSIIENHTFVGIVDIDRRFASIQRDLYLYLVDYAALSYEMFYQIGLANFSNFGTIELNDSSIEKGIDLLTLLQCVDDKDNDSLVQQLIQRKTILSTYFQIKISTSGRLLQLPLLLRSYEPSWEKLPIFIKNLATNTNFDVEIECFDNILRHLATFYVPAAVDSDSTEQVLQHTQIVRDIIFPAMKAFLVITKSLATSKRILHLTSVPKLYNVFERC